MSILMYFVKSCLQLQRQMGLKALTCASKEQNGESCIMISAIEFPPQEAIMTEYLNTKNLTEAVSGVREMKAPKHFLPEMLSKIIVCSLDRPDRDKEHASTLIHMLRTEGLITGENFMQVHNATVHSVSRCQNCLL